MYGNLKYYISISQSIVNGNYHICLIHCNMSVQPISETYFLLTIPAFQALFIRSPTALILANSNQKSCFTKQPKTIPLERPNTNMEWRFSKNKLKKPKTMLLHKDMHIFNN